MWKTLFTTALLGCMTQAATADTQQGNYTYWIDNDIQNAKTAQTATGNLSNEIDIAGYAPGLHTLNIRMKAKDCSYKYYSYKFYIAPSEKPDTTPEAEASLIGYKYGFNESVTNVKLDNLKEISFTNTLFDIPAPTEFAKVEDGKFSIDKASSTVKMSRKSELNFSMQFQGSNRQWSNILHKDTVIADNINRQAVELKPYSSISLDKIGRGDFHAVKFTIDKANTYYLVSSKASRIALYNENGTEMQRFSETDTQQGKATYFNTGTYYAVVYNLGSNTSLRLSDKQNAMPTPVINYKDEMLSISCTDADAKVYYTLDGTEPNAQSKLYKEAFKLDHNATVKAIAIGKDCADSYIATYQIDSYAVAAPTISYSNLHISITTPTADAKIYYTLDGTEPTSKSNLYTGPVELMKNCTVKAIAMKQWLNPSKVASYTPAYYYNGKTASLTEAGNLAKAMEWCNGEPAGNTLQVVGSLNAEDIALIASFEKLQHLDLAKANIKGCNEGGKAVGDNTLADQAFANMNLKTVSLPASLTACGKQLFSNNRKLAAVTWNANINIAAEVLDGINNPNLLLYVNAKSFAPATLKNVVAAGVAESITLSDIADGEASDGAFFCPSAFVAKKITYTRNFQQATVIGTSEGNETISLPFDVQEMTHETNGKIAPFAKGLPTGEAKPFWLYDLSQGAATFTRAADIQAYKPYIICMPNSEYYSDEYILAGKVTFSAENANIAVTRNEVESNGQKDFVSNLEQLSQQDGVYALNVGEAYQDYKPGSVFVSDAFVVHPFQAYIQNVTTTASRCLAVFDEATTAIESIPMKQVAGLDAWSVSKTLYIHSDITRWVNIFSTKGMLIKTVKIAAGETESIESLPSGVYIVNQKKIAIK